MKHVDIDANGFVSFEVSHFLRFDLEDLVKYVSIDEASIVGIKVFHFF